MRGINIEPMYGTKILEHLEHPRNVGALDDASARGEATNPVCGDLLKLFLRVEDGIITGSGFLVEGCPPSIAAGSVLTEMIRGMSIEAAGNLAPADVTRELQSLPRNKEHCSLLVIDALRAALAQLRPGVL